MQVVGTTQSTAGLGVYCYNASASSDARISFLRSKNAAIGSHTVVASGDDLGSLVFAGSDGTGFIRGAIISALVDGTPGASDMPTRLQFQVTPDGGTSPVEALRIRQDKSLQLAGSSGPIIVSGSGTPEGVVTAAIGSLFMRTNGGAGTSLYVKETGAGNTGWVGK
jgi:hypothetical protein